MAETKKRKSIFATTIEQLVVAMKDYNYMLINGTFSQWQVALAKYETLRDLLIASGHRVKVVSKASEIGSSVKYFHTAVVVDGRKYLVPAENEEVERNSFLFANRKW